VMNAAQAVMNAAQAVMNAAQAVVNVHPTLMSVSLICVGVSIRVDNPARFGRFAARQRRSSRTACVEAASGHGSPPPCRGQP
jgi:hypothetical protein